MLQPKEYEVNSENVLVEERARISPFVDKRKGRAWLEINTKNLKYNARLLKRLMPTDCEMMAVVKANAYGHGAVKVSKCMNEIGVRAFAVATVDEGI